MVEPQSDSESHVADDENPIYDMKMTYSHEVLLYTRNDILILDSRSITKLCQFGILNLCLQYLTCP
ncbi:MAG: hypothetical protein QME62_13445, partial [Armatimonadota bacterium]|nr:hypothetical protein [Armatimonadota bacterium]